MTARALLASRAGPVTSEFAEIVSQLGYTAEDSLVTDSPEDNQYHLPPGLVETLRECSSEKGVEFLAIDGIAHAGQMVDLNTALPSMTIRDRRGVILERLAGGGNAAAAARLALRDRRVARRRARRDQRSGSAAGPSGTSGAVSELERACEQQIETLQSEQDTLRQRVSNSYDGIGTHVTIVGTMSAPTTEYWEALTGEQGGGGPLRPASPTTAVTEIGPHTVAVTDIPGLTAGENEWFVDAVPGTVAAIDRSDILLVVESTDDIDRLLPTDGFDGAITRWSGPKEPAKEIGLDRPGNWSEQLVAEIQPLLPTTRLAVTLPSTDAGHGMVSTLHEETTVETIEYGDEIRLKIEMPDAAVEQLSQQIKQVGGSCRDQ